MVEVSILDIFLFFFGGFGLGYGLASRSERKRINTIVGYFDRIDQAGERMKEKIERGRRKRG
jgi:hypothetical protein